MKLVECVPNFSEGRDKNIIDAITSEITKVSDVILLDVDPGFSTNRTVVTFAGGPDEVLTAAFLAIKKAAELIDMTKHRGAHPRIGATDVCPFIPISSVTMEECATLAKRLGKRVGDELNIPVYLYEYASESRKSLQSIREGEYEGLPVKLTQKEWKPDFGNAEFNKKSGATVIGARNFLIAYNVNLNTKNIKIAKEIGLKIRDTGRIKRDSDGNKILDSDGKTIMEPGILNCCKATGWYVDEYKRAQVTMNLTDFNVTPLYEAFDTVSEEAKKLGIRVTGSEIVGLVPKEAIIGAGKHYLKMQGMIPSSTEKEVIDAAILSLGLNDVAQFDPQKKIIEYRFEKKGRLVSLSIDDFIEELSSSKPAPGGGTVAAFSGALSSSLSSMVGTITFSKKGYEGLKDKMNEICERVEELKKLQLKKVDEDTEAFNRVMESYGLSRKTEEEKKNRENKILEANRVATSVPLDVLKLSLESIKCAREMVLYGNQNSLSDAGVAALMAWASAFGAYYNILINLREINDQNWRDDIKDKAEKIISEVDRIAKDVQEEVLKRLK